MTNVLEKGPYLHALGWTQGETYDVAARHSGDWAGLVRTLSFAENEAPTLRTAVSREAMLAPLPPALLKASGVARARSAARSTVLSALLCRELAKFVSAREGFNGDRVGLGIVSCSAIVPVFWKFESVGVGDSWGNTDTMLLPASIPSSVVTAASTVTNFHATASTFADGAAGMVGAMEHAYLDFFHDRADFSLVVCAEEACVPMIDAMTGLQIAREPIDGAAGMVLSRERLASSDWQVCFAEIVSADGTQALPDGWDHAPRLSLAYNDRCTAYTGTAVPQALHLAMSTDGDSAVVDVLLKDRCRCLIGLRR